MTEDRDVIFAGFWKTIKAMHDSMQTTAQMVEWFYDVTPDEHKLAAAQRMDAFNKMLKSCDELIAPIRKIMEDEPR